MRLAVIFSKLKALPHSWCNGLTENGKTCARNSSNSACPYICRFSVFRRLRDKWQGSGSQQFALSTGSASQIGPFDKNKSTYFCFDSTICTRAQNTEVVPSGR